MFQLIKTFIAVYESRNFTQAAEQLYLSPADHFFTGQKTRRANERHFIHS